MPLKLVPPRKGKSPFWSVRGTYLGQYVARSTKATKRAVAKQVLEKWQREIERHEFRIDGEATFLSAAVAYMKHGGDKRPLKKLLNHFGEKPLRLIDQASIEEAASALFPTHSPATRNREVFTPVSAILKHAGCDFKVKRPKGSRGRVVTRWLWPEQAFRIFDAASQIDSEFSIFLQVLCYCGPRLSEALGIRCDDVRLSESFAYIGHTKNGEPRPIFLPPNLVTALADHPRGLDRPGERLFRFHKGGGLAYLLESACRLACGLPKPWRIKRGPSPPSPPYELDWVNFHTFCHTYGTWMRRYGGLDTKGLVETGRWKSEQSASRYAHAVTGEAARKAALLPTPGSHQPEQVPVENPRTLPGKSK
jgi:integrase